MGKLVRDKIPLIIEQSGKIPIGRKLTSPEFKEEVYNKLKEEVEELCKNRNSEEMADVITVLRAIVYSDPERYEKVFTKYVRKKKELGEFFDKNYLEKVE